MPKLHCGAPTLRCGVRAAPGELPVSPVAAADGLATGGAEHRGGGADRAVPGEGGEGLEGHGGGAKRQGQGEFRGGGETPALQIFLGMGDVGDVYMRVISFFLGWLLVVENDYILQNFKINELVTPLKPDL